MKNHNWGITILIAIIAALAAFYGGMQYQKMQRLSFGQFAQGRQGGFQVRTGRPVFGEIISSDDKSVTVKLQDGSTKIVILSDNTVINKAATGSKSDLTKGSKIAVFGQTNSDGSLTAQNIQLNPQMRGMFNRSTPSR